MFDAPLFLQTLTFSQSKTIAEIGFGTIARIIEALVLSVLCCPCCLCCPPQPLAQADDINLSHDNSSYHAQAHPVIVNFLSDLKHFNG